MNIPDFYLASTESKRFEHPRRCRALKRVCSESRDDLLLIQIEPPLIGQDYGLGSNDINVVAVATRHMGDSLFPIQSWPVYVHVARILTRSPAESEHFKDAELEAIAWAELYRTEEDAQLKKM
ncbi:MAG: hypothetical protein AAB262_00355 [Elusimicrobiota bacterium]